MKNADIWQRASKSRLWIALGFALLLLLLLPHGWPAELRGLVAWNGAVVCFLALAWHTVLTCDAARTRKLSRREDEHRSTIDSVLLFASVASMGGVLQALSHASDAKDALAMQLTVAAVVTVILSWTLIHTIYAFHYARLYYEGARYGDAGGGVDFHGDEPPDYLDFCYLSFAVGTTFGATDSEVGGRPIRRTILKHSVLSFTFATVIVALTLSVISSLLGGS